jgi:hypothetical protein
LRNPTQPQLWPGFLFAHPNGALGKAIATVTLIGALALPLAGTNASR